VAQVVGAERPERGAELVAALVGALDERTRLEISDPPIRLLGRDPDPCGKRGERERLVRRHERVEQIECPLEHLDPGPACGIVCSARPGRPE
jgi:hypothetical protein